MNATNRTRHALRELVLSTAAVVGGICILASICSLAFGLKPLLFRSGSMTPAISTGSLAIARTVPASGVAVGDVVSVTDAAGARVTHRVVDVDAGPVTTLVLKGDANAYVDPSTYRVVSVDLVLFHIEGLGYVVGLLRHPTAIFFGGLLVGALIMMAFGPRGPNPPSGDSGARGGQGPAQTAPDSDESVRPTAGPSRSPGGICSTAAVLGGFLALHGVVAIPQTDAAFVDRASAISKPFATPARIAAPRLNCELVADGSIQFSWTEISGVSGYDLMLSTADGKTAQPQMAGTTNTTISGALGTSGVATIRAKISYASTTWYSVASNRRSYAFMAGSRCA